MEEPNLEGSCAGRLVVVEGVGGHECAERGHRPAGLRAGGGARPHPAPTTARTDARYDTLSNLRFTMTGPDSLQSRATGARLSLLLRLPASLCLALSLRPASCPMPVSSRCVVGRARRAGGHFVVLVNDGDGQDDVWDMERRAREFNDKDKLDEQAALQVGTGAGERMQGCRGEKIDRIRPTRFTTEH